MTESRSTNPCADAQYGAHPRAHPAVERFAEQVDAILADEVPGTTHTRVADALTALLAIEDLLAPEHRLPGEDRYRKHVLYADPRRRFTLLALVWRPGQGTVIHGHTAWGAVGVYEGTPNVACYDCREHEGGRHTAVQTKDIACRPGDMATVRPGLADVHRIYNASSDTMITLHAYGRDLVEDPDAINLYLNLSA